MNPRNEEEEDDLQSTANNYTNADQDEEEVQGPNNNNNAPPPQLQLQPPDPDFMYKSGSTACILIQNPVTRERYTVHLHSHPNRNVNPFIPPSTSIRSSSIGLLLCHKHSSSTSISTYFVGNPFKESPYNCFHPSLPHHSDSDAVLANSPSGRFFIVCLLPNPTQEGNIAYAIEAYASHCRNWFTLAELGTHLHDEKNRVVIPNSGISCKRFAYWLTWQVPSRTNIKVMRVDIKNCINSVKYPLLSYLSLPHCLPKQNEGEPPMRMTLGRVKNRVGFVVVNEKRTRLEMYMMVEKGSVSGDENDDDAEMKEWEQFPGCLKVDLDERMGEEEVVVVELNRIKCRRMPEVVKFESIKMDVVVAVGGGRRMLLWESRWSDKGSTRVVEVPGVVSDGSAPYLVERGVPHLCTSVLPNIAGLDG